MKRYLWFIIPIFLFSSCVDIVDDLTLNNDGSGKLRLSINLSKSKLEVNSLLALDSLNGQRVPKLSEITSRIPIYVNKIRSKEGITEVRIEKEDTINFILKIEIGFSDVEHLEAALKEVVSEEDTRWVNFDFDWVKWEDNTLTRNNIKIPDAQLKKLKYEDIEKLKQGTYTSVTHFQNVITDYSNPLSVLSPNKLNLMIRTSAYQLVENAQSLKNQIKISESVHK